MIFLKKNALYCNNYGALKHSYCAKLLIWMKLLHLKAFLLQFILLVSLNKKKKHPKCVIVRIVSYKLHVTVASFKVHSPVTFGQKKPQKAETAKRSKTGDLILSSVPWCECRCRAVSRL